MNCDEVLLNNFSSNENKKEENKLDKEDFSNQNNMQNNNTLIYQNLNDFQLKNINMVLPKNIKKYAGHIREFDNRYTFEYISNNLKAKELFYIKDLGGKNNAKEAAILFQKKWCQNNSMITNLYYIVNNEYILVNLNDNYQMKVDLDDIDLIEKYNWRIQNNSQFATTFKTIDKKRTFTPFYKLKFKSNKVHFKNNDKLDYRNENIIII